MRPRYKGRRKKRGEKDGGKQRACKGGNYRLKMK